VISHKIWEWKFIQDVYKSTYSLYLCYFRIENIKRLYENNFLVYTFYRKYKRRKKIYNQTLKNGNKNKKRQENIFILFSYPQTAVHTTYTFFSRHFFPSKGLSSLLLPLIHKPFSFDLAEGQRMGNGQILKFVEEWSHKEYLM